MIIEGRKCDLVISMCKFKDGSLIAPMCAMDHFYLDLSAPDARWVLANCSAIKINENGRCSAMLLRRIDSGTADTEGLCSIIFTET